MTTEPAQSSLEALFERAVEVPPALEQLAREKDWPDGLVRRALELRLGAGTVENWIDGEGVSADHARQLLDWRERLMVGTLRVREVAWDDDEALVDMYANSPEEIGEWEVTTERGPYPFAQFRLQENWNMQLLEDRGVALGAKVHSTRNTFVDGHRIAAHVQSAFRVRKEARGMGCSHLLRMCAGPARGWYGMLSYYFVRSENFGALDWIKALRPEMFPEGTETTGGMPGQQVSVHQFPARPFDGDARAIRRARRDDAEACVRLINRTHDGFDLFRPYSVEFLESRLDDVHWGPKPEAWTPVYDWQDYFLLEDGGEIVACGGLWDRGRHVREVWRHKERGDEHTIAPTALMDFGYADGREDAMAVLIGHFTGLTQQYGRDLLMAPVELLPDLVAQLEQYEPTTDTRALQRQLDPEIQNLDPKIRRPYTDLAYW